MRCPDWRARSLARRPAALLVSLSAPLVYTSRTNGQVWWEKGREGERGRRRGWGEGTEVLQNSGAKWGDRDNDNVRSALAGGLLRLMDALIISKQELQ